MAGTRRLIPDRASRARALRELAQGDIDSRGQTRRSPIASGVDLSHDLQAAMAQGLLSLRYQPIIRLRTGDCLRVEALLRWEHPQLGRVPPAEILLLAEPLGVLPQIGRFVLSTALRQRAAWLAQDLELGVAINLAVADLSDPDLVDRLTMVLRSEMIDPADVTIDLPASALHDRERADEVRRLSECGVRLAIDGLSASPPPPRAILHLVHELKVSRGTTARAVADPRARLALRRILELARDLGLSAVAVGVEDRATRDLVLRLGFDEAQGDLMSRPLLAGDLAPWRGWVARAALAGGMAATAHASAGPVTAGIGQLGHRVGLTGLVSTCCTLTFARPGPSAATPDRAMARAEFEKRTGTTLASVATSRAELLVEKALPAADGRNLAVALDEAIATVENDYGRAFMARPSVYVFSTRASFAHGLEQGFGYRGPTAGMLAAANGGVTLLREGVIAVNWANVSAADPAIVLRHELTHAMVHQIIGPNVELPAWMDEGLATLGQQDAGASPISRDPYVVLSLLTAGRASLQDLSTSADWLAQNAKLDGEGYRVAAAAVGLIEARSGRDGMIALLEETARSGDFSIAYARSAGEPLAAFTASFPARMVEAHPGPAMAVVPWEDGERYLLSGFTPGTQVAIGITGAGYDLHFTATADRLGLYEAVFGSTAPPGAYELTATGPGGRTSGALTVTSVTRAARAQGSP